MTITSLMDNYCDKGGLRGELGLSLVIREQSRQFLLDSGAGPGFLANAKALGIDIKSTEGVVLSHGHYDHSGGLSDFYAALHPSQPPLYAGPGYQRRRFAVSAGEHRQIGMPLGEDPSTGDGRFARQGRAAVPPALIVEGLRELGPGLFILPKAEMGDSWRLSARFKSLEGDQEIQDDFSDELSLVALGEGAISVISGCAHRGILNIVESALRAFPGRELDAVIGGFHFTESNPAEMAGIASALATLKPKRVLCAHCTGIRGYAALAAALPDRTQWLACGASLTI